MQDHPQYNMFLQEGLRQVMSVGSKPQGMAIVSSFDPNKAEDENVLALRQLYKYFPYQQVDLLYDHDFGVIAFQVYENQLPQLREYCEQAVQEHHQLGYVEWNGKKAHFIAADGTKTSLLPWDSTIERLEEWIGKIHTGFKVQGIWNREMTYVNMKLHESET